MRPAEAIFLAAPKKYSLDRIISICGGCVLQKMRNFIEIAANRCFLAVCLLVLHGCGPLANLVDSQINGIEAETQRPVPQEHLAQHASWFVADLHADTLMWDRDLLREGRWGHADVPRLRRGGVDLQLFTVVTGTPMLQHGHSAGRPCVPADGINFTGLLSVVQPRPTPTWFSLKERALYQGRRLNDAIERSTHVGGIRLVAVRSAADLVLLISRSTTGESVIGALLGLEGANWIGEPGYENVEAEVASLREAGFRTIALTHRYDNALAGASEGCMAGGLTPLGERTIRAAIAEGLIIDLSHLSPRSLRDTLPILRELGHAPLVSHAGVRASCAPPDCQPDRNLADDELVAIARLGGVIGIGFWPEAVGAGGTDAIVLAFARAAEVLRRGGLDPWDHLALGSDFDGAVSVPFDAAGLPGLTWALRQGRDGAPALTEDALVRVVGGNVRRLLAEQLPGGSRGAPETHRSAPRQRITTSIRSEMTR